MEAIPSPDWVVASGSNTHVASHRSWFGADYREFESFVYGNLDSAKVPVVGIGSVDLPVKTLPGKSHRGHGVLQLRNVLHVPSGVCNLIGWPLFETHDVNTHETSDASLYTGDIKTLSGEPVAFFKPKTKKVSLLVVRLSGPPIGPVVGHSYLENSENSGFILSVTWPPEEQERYRSQLDDCLQETSISTGVAGSEYPAPKDSAHLDWASDVSPGGPSFNDSTIKNSVATKPLKNKDSAANQDVSHDGKARLNKAERAWLKKHYGNESDFLSGYEMSIHKDSDREEGREILRSIMGLGRGLPYKAKPTVELFRPGERHYINKLYGSTRAFFSLHNLNTEIPKHRNKARHIIRKIIGAIEYEKGERFKNESQEPDSVFDHKELAWIKSHHGSTLNFVTRHNFDFGDADDRKVAKTLVGFWVKKSSPKAVVLSPAQTDWVQCHFTTFEKFMDFYDFDQRDIKSQKEALALLQDTMDDDNGVVSDESEESDIIWVESGRNDPHPADVCFDRRQLEWIQKHYNDSSSFMISHGLKPHDLNEGDEASRIAERMMVEEEEEKKAAAKRKKAKKKANKIKAKKLRDLGDEQKESDFQTDSQPDFVFIGGAIMPPLNPGMITES